MSEAIALLPPLTESEQKELEECERVVGYGLEMFLAACRALRVIREKRLYRAHHKSWQEYITDRWGSLMTDSGTADRWINVAVVNENVTPVGVTIEHDRHARELVKFQPAIQQAVALVGVRAAELEAQVKKKKTRVTESHFKHAGRIISEMVTTGTVELGEGQQHPIIETLAVSVVVSRRESTLQRIAPRVPVLDIRAQASTPPAHSTINGAPVAPTITITNPALESGKVYEIKIYEVAPPPE